MRAPALSVAALLLSGCNYCLIDTTPKGARIYKDDEFVGTSPCEITVGAWHGFTTSHSIKAEKEGYSSAHEFLGMKFQAIRGAFWPTDLHMTLTSKSGEARRLDEARARLEAARQEGDGAKIAIAEREVLTLEQAATGSPAPVAPVAQSPAAPPAAAPAPAATPSPAKQARFCSACATEFANDTARFCAGCGAARQ